MLQPSHLAVSHQVKAADVKILERCSEMLLIGFAAAMKKQML